MNVRLTPARMEERVLTMLISTHVLVQLGTLDLIVLQVSMSTCVLAQVSMRTCVLEQQPSLDFVMSLFSV